MLLLLLLLMYDSGPDGGYGWAVVAGAFFGYFTSFGTETAWFFWTFISDPQCTLWRSTCDRDGRYHILGLELAGFTSQIWHLYLTQGVLFGLGSAFLYVSALSVPSQWFNKRRGLGLGIVTYGAGVGGVVLPFVIMS
ncbi:hypothetical protein BDB00DRAFT_785259 [Zychaea mexicana]|uniref:uncharacterized protein n=1 Tax=Zychaea mexicana TaxID=64656 RepID=UPI0022FF0CF8|nr:uncharacterized protein BDB00DRAFT_785259 [Zychaea mexicana]KAI9496816.1 hypothetical protein BDB00DRAFT_785259 [Zychaea mexicana]